MVLRLVVSGTGRAPGRPLFGFAQIINSEKNDMNEKERLERETVDALVIEGEAEMRQFRIDEQVRGIIATAHSIHFADENGQISFLDANSLITRAYDVAEMSERERLRRRQTGADAVELALRERGYIEPDAEGGPVEVLADA